MVDENRVDLDSLIEIVPGKRSGRACIKESNITVSDVIGMLREGMSSEEILGYFPVLNEDHILACLAHEAKHGVVRE